MQFSPSRFCAVIAAAGRLGSTGFVSIRPAFTSGGCDGVERARSSRVMMRNGRRRCRSACESFLLESTGHGRGRDASAGSARTCACHFSGLLFGVPGDRARRRRELRTFGNARCQRRVPTARCKTGGACAPPVDRSTTRPKPRSRSVRTGRSGHYAGAG